MRTYEGEKKMPPKNCRYKKFYTDGDTENYKIRPTGYFKRKAFGVRNGLKLIHIGEGVWRIGKEKRLKDGRLHQVIYSPNDKEFHIYDNDVNQLKTQLYDDGDNMFYRHSDYGNYADPSNVKIYILTSILDERSNWCFDLSNKPEPGKLKVIYSNGKVMNIDFNGEWLLYNTKTREFTETVVGYNYQHIHPVAYRKITNHVV